MGAVQTLASTPTSFPAKSTAGVNPPPRKFKTGEIFMKRRIIHIYTAWIVKCSWCGLHTVKATDGRNIFCSSCGH